MNPRHAVPLLFGLAALLLSACESTQGTSPAIATVQSTQTGQQRIDPAPETKSYQGQKDVFQGAEYDPGVGPLPAGAKRLQLRVGQVIEVYRGSNMPGDGQREMAFYLPVEARSVVQLVVEQRGLVKTYFLRAVGIGDTVGGVVERRWLNSAGFDPDSLADEARIQNAVRAAPFLISVTQ
jgi:hypothetical protein